MPTLPAQIREARQKAKHVDQIIRTAVNVDDLLLA